MSTSLTTYKKLLLKRIALALILLSLVTVLALLQHQQTDKAPTLNSLLTTGMIAHPLSSLNGEEEEAGEISPDKLEEYWRTQLTFPTGNLDPAWIRAAFEQHLLMMEAVPSGEVTYRPGSDGSPLTLDPNRWTALGPQPIQSGSRRDTGRVKSIAVDPVNPNVVYIAAVGGGVWKSTNCCSATTSWVLKLDDPLISTTSVSDIVIDQSNRNIIYAATGSLRGFPSIGLLKSSDQGETWTVLGSGLFSIYGNDNKVRVDPRNNNIVVAGVLGGVHLSYDGGASWTDLCSPQSGQYKVRDLRLIGNSSSTDLLMAAVYGGVFKATIPSAGCPASWRQVWDDGADRVDLGTSTGNPDYVYLQESANSAQLGVWRSTDKGETWEQRSGLNALNRNCMGQPEPLTQNSWNQVVTVDPNNPDTIYMGTTTLWRSTDGGISFVDVGCAYSGGILHPDQHALSYLPGSSSTLLIGTDGGMFLTQNASVVTPTIIPINTSLNTIEFFTGDISPNFATSPAPRAIGGSQDNGTSVGEWSGTPVPVAWTRTHGGDGVFAYIEPMLQQRWYQEFQNGNMYVTTDGPYSQQINITGGWASPPPDGERRAFLFPYELYKYNCPSSGCTHLIAGSYRIWETVQGGVPASSWYPNSPALDGSSSYIDMVSYSVNSSSVAVASSGGAFWYGFNLGQGVADSATWVSTTVGLPGRIIEDVTTDPVNPLIAYAAVSGFSQNTPNISGQLFQITCTANCASYSWVDKSGNLPNVPLRSVIANPRYRQQVFVGSVWGLYYTNNIDDNSPTWYRFQAGLPNVSIFEMSIDAGFTTLSVWTQGRGAYVWPLPSGNYILPTPTATPTPCAGFSDVPPDSTFYPFITCLVNRDIVSGYSDCTFRPSNNVTRGQLSKIVSQAAGFADPAGSQIFEDIAPGTTFYDFVQRLASRGIINGYPCGGAGEPCGAGNRPYFRPNSNATRGQISKIVAVAAGFVDPPGAQIFEDVAMGSTFFDYIQRLANQGVMNGYPCGGPGEPCGAGNRPYFRPSNNATRGQVSKIVANSFFPGCSTRR